MRPRQCQAMQRGVRAQIDREVQEDIGMQGAACSLHPSVFGGSQRRKR